MKIKMKPGHLYKNAASAKKSLKERSLILMAGFLMAASCTTGGKLSQSAPSWFTLLEEGPGDNCRIVKTSAFGISEDEARKKAVKQGVAKILRICKAEKLYQNPDDKAMLAKMIETLTEETEQPLQESLISLYREESLPAEEGAFYYGAFCLKPGVEKSLKELLMEQYYGTDSLLGPYLEAAAACEEKGQLYSGAEQLLQTAVLTLNMEGPLTREAAQSFIDRSALLLNRIQVQMATFPKMALADRKIGAAYLSCKTDSHGVPGVEFLVRYQGRKRDGSSGQFERRLVSNNTGIVEFFHPFVPFVGASPVIFTGGSRQIHSDISMLENAKLDVSQIKAWLDSASFSEEIMVESSAKITSIGIVILQNDMAGKSLNRDDTAESLRDSLKQAGYDVKILDLAPGEIAANTETDFLRKAGAVYRSSQRILFGMAGLRDFEERGRSVRVETAGWIKLADRNSGEIILNIQESNSVESRKGNQAISTSFHELGKAFAQDIIHSLE